MSSRFPVTASVLTAIALALAGATRASALDPARTLTQYVHRIWQVPQGLPQASIYAVAQTADGRLWLGTQTGLVRFDGVRFTTFDENNGVSLPNVWVTALVEDRQHTLWIGTDDSGVLRLDHAGVTRYGLREGLPSGTVRCLFTDHDGRLWVCTAEGLAAFDGSRFKPFTLPASRTPLNVNAACETPDHHLWIAHDGRQLDTWPSRGGDAVSVSAAMSKAGVIRTMLCASSGDVWIGMSGGLVHVTGNRARLVTTSTGLADNAVVTLAESRDGAVLVGTSNGFSRIRREVESFRPDDGLSQSTVYALYEDREGTLWVGTGHGLNQFLDGRATPYTTSEGLPSNNAGPVLRDHAGGIWVGTLGAGLARFDGRRFTTLTTRDGLASNRVLALAEDARGSLWVGTDRGLNRICGGRIDAAWTTAQGLPDDRIRALVTDASGTLWIGTARGLAVYHDGVIERRASGRAPIVAMGAAPDGAVYVAPDDDSLERYSGKTGTTVDYQPALRHVDAIYTDADGVLWLGTGHEGLFAIDHGQISHYTSRDGLFDDSIYAILGDSRGRLWMACSKGIFSVDRLQLRRFTRGTSSKLTSTPYSPTDVLRTIECKPGVQPAAFESPDGRLWFSTTRGLLVLDSRNAERRFDAPPAAVEAVTVNGEQVDASSIGTLPPGRNNVTFRYTGFSFVVPARISFRYMLEGFDTKWIDAGARREAFYTNLPPGHFRFLVSACNIEGQCRAAANAAAFSIEPRYDQRTWFIPLCLTCTALFGLTVYRLRMGRLRDQFALILAERSRIARELHDTLLQGFSGLTMAMQALAVRLPPSDERRTLELIVADAGTSLREARRSLSGLRSRPDTGSNFAAALAQMSQQLTNTRGVRLKLKLDEWDRALPPDVEYNLLRIAQEAVLNAVTHSGTRSVLVALERTATRVRLLIEDEGSGFDGGRAGQAGHYGVPGMRERAAEIGADLDVETAPGFGTAVSVTMDA